MNRATRAARSLARSERVTWRIILRREGTAAPRLSMRRRAAASDTGLQSTLGLALTRPLSWGGVVDWGVETMKSRLSALGAVVGLLLAGSDIALAADIAAPAVTSYTTFKAQGATGTAAVACLDAVRSANTFILRFTSGAPATASPGSVSRTSSRSRASRCRGLER